MTQLLLRSSLLQGSALDVCFFPFISPQNASLIFSIQSLLSLYAELVIINAKQASFDQLLDSLIAIVANRKGEPLSKQSFSSIAQVSIRAVINSSN